MRSDEVMTGKAPNAFCAMRPPGHHAETVRPMGFCLFNSAAIAARHAQKKHGAERVAIVDFDVHHGNALQSHWQMMGALEAVDGMLLFGVSTAYIFAVLQGY